MQLSKVIKLVGAIAAIITIATQSIQASGFAVMEQSAKSLGTATAGATASKNPDSVYFNPAGMTSFKAPALEVGLSAVIPSFEFNNNDSKYLLNQQPITGTEPDAGQTEIVPNLYYILPVGDNFAVGLAFNAPYGLETKYDSDWIGRYSGIRSDMTVMQFSPTVAWQINDNISIGAGASIGYLDATLTSAIDFGSIVYGATDGAMGLPGAMDGDVDLSGDDVGYGFNIGLMYQFNENTRIGIDYKSEVKYKITGDATFNVPSAIKPLLSPMFTDCGISAEITTPAVAAIGGYHRFNDLFALMADITWTGWSSFDELRIVFENPYQPDSVTEEKWDDVFRYSLGGEFYVSDAWTLRIGGAYDESPIPNDYRTVRIPGTDRIWATCGFTYMVSENLGVDFAYMHIFFTDDPDITETSSTAYINGDYSGTADVVSFSCSYSF